MRYDDWFKFEQPTFNVFSEEELEKGDLPAETKEEKKEEAKKVNPREAKKAEALRLRQEKEKAAAIERDRKKAEELKNDPSGHLFGERPLNRSQGDPELRHTK